MPIAAVPAYLGTDFRHASPGMRFGMYLKLWGVNRRTHELLWETFDVGFEIRGRDHQEREVKYENKVAALSDAKRITDNDRQVMSALFERQRQIFGTGATSEVSLRLDALSTAPFTTGLGNEHPLENGFAFLNPYGLPYLPGSGIKGVLRQAARELACGDWGDPRGWSEDRCYPLMVRGKPVLDSRKQPVMLSQLDVLFGRETPSGESEHVRGALSFWDVIPQIKGDSLLVEIMTPHQTHYYQNGATPHESGQPNPISFLTVPPGSAFTFHVCCDLALLERRAPDLAREGRWKALLEAAFAHAFDWLGFGAKTAVGYGAMAGQALPIATGSTADHGRGSASSPAKPELAPTQRWKGAVLRYNPGNGELSVSHQGESARIGNPEAQRLRESLPQEKQQRLTKKKELKDCVVETERIGNAWKIIAISVTEEP